MLFVLYLAVILSSYKHVISEVIRLMFLNLQEKSNNSWPTNIYYVEKKKKKYNSVLLSLFMNINVMCNTAQDFQPMFEHYSIFK